ncbi:MAG: ABC transporter permease [Nitrospirae bacterium]|nr:ABC transporter permease [Nitrospirota bacterium]
MTIWHELTRNRLALASLALLGLFGLLALAAPWMAPYPYDATDPARLLEGPSWDHWLGTDRLGRDLLSRLLYGARLSLAVGIVTAVGALLIGTTYGGVSGYIGGRCDQAMMRVVDVLYALPDLLVIILLTVWLGRSLGSILLAMVLVSWVTVARIARGEVLAVRELPFVEAARALGAGHGRILLRHILPNIWAPLLVTLTVRVPSAILLESTLSFLGLGLAPPFASWGTLANDGWTALRFYPHLILAPGAAIFLTVISFNFLGDALRDALEPTRGRTAR